MIYGMIGEIVILFTQNVFAVSAVFAAAGTIYWAFYKKKGKHNSEK